MSITGLGVLIVLFTHSSTLHFYYTQLAVPCSLGSTNLDMSARIIGIDRKLMAPKAGAGQEKENIIII